MRNFLTGLRCYSMTFSAFGLVEGPFILLKDFPGTHRVLGYMQWWAMNDY